MKRRNRSTRSPKRRRLLRWGLGILLVGGGILTAVRWRAWFGNVPEAPYTTPEVIDRITLTPGQYFDSQRAVSWRCGETLQDSWIEYTKGSDSLATWTSLPAEGRLIETRSGKGCYYTASIYGLTPGDRVRYRVVTGSHKSSEQSFDMPTGLDSAMSFVYLGDVQDPTGEMSRDMFAVLRDRVLPEVRPAFVSAAGDQIEGPTDAYWQVWYDALGELSYQLPWVISTGNHEYLKRGPMRELDPRWTAQYSYPHNGPEGFEGRSYYIDYPLMRLIVLDTTDINEPLSAMRHYNWISSALRTSSQPWQVVLGHHATRCVRAGRSNLIMQYILDRALRDGADLVLQGHDHAYSRRSAVAEDGSRETPVYVISTSSPKLYRNGFDPIHDRLGSGMQLYQVITVHPATLEYKSYQYSGELYDDLVIHHRGGQGPHMVEDRAERLEEIFRFDGFGSERKAERYAHEIAERKASKANN